MDYEDIEKLQQLFADQKRYVALEENTVESNRDRKSQIKYLLEHATEEEETEYWKLMIDFVRKRERKASAEIAKITVDFE